MAKAAKVYEKACDAGNGRACLMLAALTDDGRGTARNPARAKQLHTKADGLDNPPRKPPPSTDVVAADEQACRSQRSAERCSSAGAATQDTDAVKAEELFRIGCTANRQTCGLWTFAIERFRRDDASRGLRLLDQGCQESFPQACLVLAEVQHLGYRSVPRAEARAAELYQKACELGDAFSCRVTAARFRGVKQTAKADEVRDKGSKLDEEADHRGDSDRWAHDAVDQRTRGPHAQELARALAEWRMLADKARGRAQARAKRLEMAYTGHRLPSVPPFSKEDVDASSAREGSIRRSIPGLFSASK
jgi:hypothetical protein